MVINEDTKEDLCKNDCTEPEQQIDSSDENDLNTKTELSDIPAEETLNLDNPKGTSETNCLALTVRKDYNLSIVKNSIFTTFRLSWKIAVSTFLINLMKLFF